MINIYTRSMMLIAGMMSISAIGCVTGTNTFSNAMVPATRYCSIDDTPAPVFDIPVEAERSPVMRNLDWTHAGGDKVSLAP